ncbi:hypothetical protein B0H13DRAFT_1850161 [Mycena leptocephala]|nr:hypothetical protein B0H13DRAFT_1850161 [Mycena leptocephala]
MASELMLRARFNAWHENKPLATNHGTEGANENFLFWMVFEFGDRFPHIVLSFAQIIFCNTKGLVSECHRAIIVDLSPLESRFHRSLKQHRASLMITSGGIATQGGTNPQLWLYDILYNTYECTLPEI